jgi:hypothetical protein
VLKHRKSAQHLPSGITSAEAVAHPKTGERIDGLELGLGVRFVGKACLALMRWGFEYAAGFDLAEWKSVCDRTLALRDRLRGHKRDVSKWPRFLRSPLLEK